MKNKFISVITNIVLVCTVFVVSFVGYLGAESASAVYKSDRLFYNGSEQSGAVSLMFNVYESTENVLQILDILDKYQAKATFFIGGSWADDNVDCVRENF